MRTSNGLAGGLRSGAAQVARATEIATILSASGFGWLVQMLGLVHPDRHCPHTQARPVSMPERVRLTLERLGPAFIKAGQMLAVRPDYVPLEYAEALRGLHADAAPFAASEAVAIVEAELGSPLADLYAEFAAAPFAAASLSQVHRARLRDGRCVAVKIQRPGIRMQVERDLALLATLARGFERHQPRSIAFRPSDAVAELTEYTCRELDFPRELMLLARALVTLEATAMIIDPQLNLAEIARSLLPELRHILLPSPQTVREHWQQHRFDYLHLAVELPALLPEAITRLREGPTRPPPPPPPAAHPHTRRWLSLGGAFAAGASLATLARKRRRT